MNEITSTPEAINPSVVDAIRHQYKEVSAMVGVHPSILYAQAVLRPSLALAQGHALSIIQGIEVDVHEYRTSNELPGFDTAMLKMVADLKETASQLSDKEKAIIPVGETIPKDWVVSAEVGHGHAGERPCVETLRISIRTGQQMILAMLYSRNMMIVYEFVKTDLTKVISKFCAEFKPRKKGYISYRRKKQFLMAGPKTNTEVEFGFGARSLPAHARLKEMPPNSMCRYTTRVSQAGGVDAQVRRWIEQSYAEAG